MSSTDETTLDEPRRMGRQNAGKYVVLRQTQVGDLDPHDSTRSVWVQVMEEPIDAKEASAAIKSIAIREDAVDEGKYVAIPLSSFQPRNVRQIVQLSID